MEITLPLRPDLAERVMDEKSAEKSKGQKRGHKSCARLEPCLVPQQGSILLDGLQKNFAEINRRDFHGGGMQIARELHNCVGVFSRQQSHFGVR